MDLGFVDMLMEMFTKECGLEGTGMDMEHFTIRKRRKVVPCLREEIIFLD